jgi:hypothetical protein
MKKQAPYLLFLLFAVSINAQTPPPQALPATAAKCQVIDVRDVGLEKLVRMSCPENRITMQVWLPPREKALWLSKDIWINVVPMGMGQDVHVSPGRAPRSDYTRPKPVHVLIIAANAAGNARKLTAMLVSLTFH